MTTVRGSALTKLLPVERSSPSLSPGSNGFMSWLHRITLPFRERSNENAQWEKCYLAFLFKKTNKHVGQGWGE